jgi:hypothetical protein
MKSSKKNVRHGECQWHKIASSPGYPNLKTWKTAFLISITHFEMLLYEMLQANLHNKQE